MKTYPKDVARPDLEPSPTVVTIRIVDSAADAEVLLPVTVLDRLCSNDVPSRVRQCNVYRSHVVVALDGDSTVGFAAFKATRGPMCVAHEFWLDRRARAVPGFCDRGDAGSTRSRGGSGWLLAIVCHRRAGHASAPNSPELWIPREPRGDRSDLI